MPFRDTVMEGHLTLLHDVRVDTNKDLVSPQSKMLNVRVCHRAGP